MTEAVKTVCLNDSSSDEIQQALHEHRHHVEINDRKVLHRSPVCVLTATSKGFCIKEWFGRGLYDMLRNRLYGSKARKAYDAALKLRKLGIPTPKPFAVVEKREDRGTCYLITRFAERAQPLNEAVDDLLASDDQRALLPLAAAVGEEIGKLHERNIYHGDLSSKNVIVEKQENGWKVQIIDLDNIRFWRLLTRRRRAKSLSQLNDLPPAVPLRVRRAFIDAYNHYCTRQIDRTAFREIAVRTSQRIQARERRRQMNEPSVSAQHT